MLNAKEITQKVNRLAEIKQQTAVLKSEADGIEAELLKQFEADVEDTKYRTVKYSGENASVLANYADKVNLIYPSMLKEIFGNAYSDVVTEEVTYKLSANAKRLLAALYKKEYLRGTSVEMCITRITDDDKTRKVLSKRVKASDYAYMIAEAAAWQDFERLLSASGGVSDERIAKVLEYINTAVTVEETPKITISD